MTNPQYSFTDGANGNIYIDLSTTSFRDEANGNRFYIDPSPISTYPHYQPFHNTITDGGNGNKSSGNPNSKSNSDRISQMPQKPII